jgi:hypothetical protein
MLGLNTRTAKHLLSALYVLILLCAYVSMVREQHIGARGITHIQARRIAQRYAREDLAGATVEERRDGDRTSLWLGVTGSDGVPIRYRVDAHGMGFEGYERLVKQLPPGTHGITGERAREIALREASRIDHRSARRFVWTVSEAPGGWEVRGESPDDGFLSLARPMDAITATIGPDGEVARLDVLCLGGTPIFRWVLALMCLGVLKLLATVFARRRR